jgi:hypothetical protein
MAKADFISGTIPAIGEWSCPRHAELAQAINY